MIEFRKRPAHGGYLLAAVDDVGLGNITVAIVVTGGEPERGGTHILRACEAEDVVKAKAVGMRHEVVAEDRGLLTVIKHAPRVEGGNVLAIGLLELAGVSVLLNNARLKALGRLENGGGARAEGAVALMVLILVALEAP